MKNEKLIELLKITFISPEFLYLLLLLVVYIYWTQILKNIGILFKTENDIRKYFPIIPIGLSTWSIKLSYKILQPLNNSSNRSLYDWPEYWKLKYRVIFSLCIAFSCTLGSVLGWFFSHKFGSEIIGFWFLLTVGISVIVFFNLLLASFKIKEIMEE